MKKLLYVLSATLLTLLFTSLFQACNEESPVTDSQNGTLSGTITLPSDAEGKEYVIAIDKDLNGDNGFSYSKAGNCGAGITMSYNIADVEPGTYYVYAVVFVMGNSAAGPQAGDYVGMYGGSLSNPPSAPNVTINAGADKVCSFTLSIQAGSVTTGKWIATAPNFGTIDFIVDAQAAYITEVKYNFSSWACGGVVHNGSITISSTPGWAITNNKFTINTSIDPFSNDNIKVIGTFGSDGNTSTGTWEGSINNSNCTGNWTAVPE